MTDTEGAILIRQYSVYVAAGQLATPTHTSSRHVRRFYCYNTVMAASYDIIVIGAGLGGLCAAFEA
ncbi:MAG: hypothetical protein KAU31_12470, partial [Spirochaetaceae bacterium]|nr:hypothetical protein [Spirochaetaceae bacterium]